MTKVQRRHAEAEAIEARRRRARSGSTRRAQHFPACGGCRFQDLAYEAQLAAKDAWVVDSLRRIAGIAEPVVEPIVPAEDVFHYRNKMEYSFAPGPDGARARAAPRRPLGRGARRSSAAGSRPTSATRSATRCATGRARSGSRPTTRPRARATSGTSSIREGRNTGEALVQLVTHERERFDRERLIEVLTQFPQVRSIHWAVNDTPAEVTNLPTRAPLGRRGDRGAARRPALPRAPERVPADEHAHGRAAVRARARARPRSPAARRSTTSTAASARSASRWRATR